MAGKGMFSNVKSALKELKADLVGVKHEAQTSIVDASMRKAVLGDSEKAVKEDIHAIRKQLENLLRVLETRAQMLLSQVVQTERDAINSDVLFLEEMHKSAEEIEEAVTAKTSNISLKVLKEGREKCDASREQLSSHKQGQGDRKCARYILHPVLAYILEQMEDFSMGDVIVVPAVQEADQEDTDDASSIEQNGQSGYGMTPRQNPINTSFMRSDTLKSVKLKSNEVENKPGQVSRQNSKVTKPGPTERQLSNDSRSSGLSRQNSKVTPRQKSEVKRKPSIAKPLAMSKSNSEVDQRSIGKTARMSTDKNDEGQDDDLKKIAGLKATLAKRSTTAPLLNLMSKEQSTFLKKDTSKPDSPDFKYRETLTTIAHKTSCYITGIAVMSNGSVVVTDTVHDSLQLFDPNFQQISEMECSHPWGVTPVSDTAIAVTLHYEHKLILVKTEKELERLNEKEILVKCKAGLLYDVKYHEYRLYVLCMLSEVHVLDLKGRQYKVLKTGISQNNLKFLAVDKDNLSIVLTGEAGIACMNFDGLPLWHYKTRSKPKFLATGVLIQNGRVFVCDWENHRIVEVYGDGEDVRTVFNENIERPLAIAASEEGDTVLVTQGDYEMSKEKAVCVKVVTVKNIPSLRD